MWSRALGATLVIPLLSALTSPAIPIALRAVLCALWATAIVRPHYALVALTLVVPFSTWFLTFGDLAPVRLAEAMVLATLSGALVAAARSPRTPLRSQSPRLWRPAALFITIVVCSAGVGLAVTQTGTRLAWPFWRSLAAFLTSDYLISPPAEFVGITSAALLIEGVALVFVVARHARDGVARPLHLLCATAVAGGAAAMLTIGTHLVAAGGPTDSLSGLVSRLLVLRRSVHVLDVNAAGSYFAMAGLVALCLGYAGSASSSKRANDSRWTTLAVLSFVAVWITGSRTAVVAAIAGAALFTALLSRRWKQWPRWSIVTAGVVVALILGAIAVGVDPRPAAARTASNMFTMRRAFVVTGLRMMASAPLFGVGIGQYFDASGRFMPPEIYWFYFHENAHNNFLQIGGELGLVGLLALLWLLGAAVVRIGRGLAASPQDRLLTGAVAGLAAFVATWMTGHPLLVPEVAYPFWMLLGASVARADGDALPALTSQQSAPGVAGVARWRRPAVGLAAALLVVLATVPFRASREAARLDFATATYGFYDWGDSEIGRARWTSRRATFFIPGTARELRLPLRALHLGRNTGPTAVSIEIDGRELDRRELRDNNWTTVRLRLPARASARAYRRVDLTTTPAWSPAKMVGGRADVRVLGVQTGEVTVDPK